MILDSISIPGVPWSSGSTSTLTRAGSLTPQWMHSKTPGVTKTDRIQTRGSKRTPEERESLKSKERWASGPDSVRKWTEVQVSGRKRVGWTTDDHLSRTVNDRKTIEKSKYVSKGSKWNDEERGENWRHSMKNSDQDASKRTSAVLRISANTHTVIGGALRAPPTTPKTTVVAEKTNGIKQDSILSSTKARFSHDQLLRIHRELLEKTGSVLPLPEGLDESNPELLRTSREALVPHEEAPRESQNKTTIAGVNSMELEVDSWVYKDPSGVVRGPYTKEEVLDWWQEGYFPLDLQIQSQVTSKENWMPLRQLLTAWGVPLESLSGLGTLTLAPIESIETTRSPLEHVSSLPTVGSHIPVAALMDQGIEGLTEEDSRRSQQNFYHTAVSPTTVQDTQIPFGNSVRDFQTIQNLIMQQQQQQQQLPAFNLNGNPVSQFAQNSAILGTGFGLQQGLQAPQVPQTYARSPLEGAGLNFRSTGVRLGTAQLTGNNDLATLFQNGNPQSQSTIQQLLQQQNLASCDSQRLMENRSTLLGTNGGIFGAPGGDYPALECLMQRSQAPLLGMGYADQFTNLSRQSPRAGGVLNENLMSLRGSQKTGNFHDGLTAPTQQTSVSPVNLHQSFQQEQDSSLIGQNSTNQNRPVNLHQSFLQEQDSGFSGQNSTNQNCSVNLHQSFPQEQDFSIIKQNSTNQNFPVNLHQSLQQEQDSSSSVKQNSTNQNSSVKEQCPASNPRQVSSTKLETPVSTPESVKPKGLPPVAPDTHHQKPRGTGSNAWGLSASSVHPASLLEIQEEEIKGTVAPIQQPISVKENKTQNLAAPSGWNVPKVKPAAFMDIMQEDEQSRKQNKGKIQSQQNTTGPKKNPVWSKPRPQAKGVQSIKKGSKTQEEGFWNLDGPTGQSKDVRLFTDQSSISPEFSKWCIENLVQLGGTGDLTLIEFLMTLNNGLEIAEYIKAYFPTAPTGRLANFISEFLKRKDVHETCKEKSGKTKNPDPMTNDDAQKSGSTGKTTTRTKEVKPRGKKTVKGQHLPPDMLGFKSNVNLGTRYRSGSIS
eukprot:g8189.t1